MKVNKNANTEDITEIQTDKCNDWPQEVNSFECADCTNDIRNFFFWLFYAFPFVHFPPPPHFIYFGYNPRIIPVLPADKKETPGISI